MRNKASSSRQSRFHMGVQGRWDFACDSIVSVLGKTFPTLTRRHKVDGMAQADSRVWHGAVRAWARPGG
jgi:hypothetical protein